MQRLSPRCVALLGSALRVWRDACPFVKLAYLEKVLSSQAPGLAAAEPADAAPGDAQNDALSQAPPPSAAAAKAPPFTPAVLSTCLDILLATAETETLGTFIASNIRKVNPFSKELKKQHQSVTRRSLCVFFKINT